jgi:16S rRNA (cytosine1402-N4)-methyltransferase
MHKPVMLQEVVELLGIEPGGLYIDGTLGGGGHTEAILAKSQPGGRVLGVDRDPEALARTAERLSTFGSAAILEKGNFAEMKEIAERRDFRQVDAVLLDLGMSSNQLDSPRRGFSFLRDGPLDMRMDPSQETTAANLVNGMEERRLADLIRELGEEPCARRIAHRIVQERSKSPIETTGRLASMIEEVCGRRGRTHPATRTFQALRMAVNEEIESLREGLDAALSLVVPGGRIAVITFHSIEDREVKHFFARHAGRWESLPEGGERWIGEEPAVRLVTRKPVAPAEEEVKDNPRARSAKLRVAERLAAKPKARKEK